MATALVPIRTSLTRAVSAAWRSTNGSSPLEHFIRWWDVTEARRASITTLLHAVSPISELGIPPSLLYDILDNIGRIERFTVIIRLRYRPIRANVNVWLKPVELTSTTQPPSLTRKTRKPSPPLMRAYATPRLAVRYPSKRSESSFPSGLPPPLHAKCARRPVRHRGACRPGRRGCFPFWRSFARSRRFARPVPTHGEHDSQAVACAEASPQPHCRLLPDPRGSASG